MPVEMSGSSKRRKQAEAERESRTLGKGYIMHKGHVIITEKMKIVDKNVYDDHITLRDEHGFKHSARPVTKIDKREKSGYKIIGYDVGKYGFVPIKNVR